MARVISIVLLAAGIGGGTYAAKNFHFDVERDSEGALHQVTIVPVGSPDGVPAPGVAAEPLLPRSSREVIRIATFNLAGLDEQKLANRRVHDILIEVLPRFDVVAIQDVRTRNDEVWKHLVEKINASGRHYDFATTTTEPFMPGQLVGGQAKSIEPCGAFLFNKASIEIDRATLQTIDDPANLFAHDPLMAQFRTRAVEPAEAFTFKLVSIHTDSTRANVEIDLLDDLYRAVRDNGDKEDDVILVGTFATLDGQINSLTSLLDMTMAVANTPTTVGKRPPLDNLFFNGQATSEFNGCSAVSNLMAEFNLTLQGALEVSEHFPVWAEFHCRESASMTRMATTASQPTR